MTRAQALQRVVVRMLYDPVFAQAVRAQPDSALAGLDLPEGAVAWLLTTDPRALDTDPFRRSRGVQSLIELFPVSCACLAQARGIPALDSFFSSPHFHESIQRREAMRAAFTKWLEAEFGRALPVGVVALEAAMVDARLGRQAAAHRPGAWLLRRDAAVAKVPEGALQWWQSAHAALIDHPEGPVGAIAHGHAPLSWAAPSSDAPPEHWLAERTPAGGAALSGLSPALAGILAACEAGATLDELAAVAAQFDASPAETRELLGELEAEGLLTQCL
jgi:hypothetical protein